MISEKIKRLEVLNHSLRNGILKIEEILREMNKSLKKYEEELNDLKTKTK